MIDGETHGGRGVNIIDDPLLSSGTDGRDQLTAFIGRLSEAGITVPPLISLTSERKDPDTTRGDQIIVDDKISPEYKITVDEAMILMEGGINIGVYAFPDGLLMLDFDVRDGKTIIPIDVVHQIIETYDTFTVRTRSGGFCLYFLSDGEKISPHLYYKSKDAGECRRKQYVVAPGSYVPRDYTPPGKKPKGFTEDATGYYEIIRDVPIKCFDPALLPADVTIGKPKKEQRKPIPTITTLSDQDVINKAHDARNGSKFNDLFDRGNWKFYYQSQSEADLALCMMIGFYTQDGAQIDSIFRQSALYRDKWDRDDYRERTISEVLGNIKERYTPPKQRSKGKIPDDIVDCPQFSFDDEDKQPTIDRPKEETCIEYRYERFSHDILEQTVHCARSDPGNAMRFSIAYGQDTVFNPVSNRWHLWNGISWKETYYDVILNMCKNVAANIYTETSFISDEESRKAHISFAFATNKAKSIREIERMARGNRLVETQKFDTRDTKINMLNGVYDLHNHTFHDGGIKEEWHCKVMGIEYDPTAVCPEFIKFLGIALKDNAELIRNVQMLLGSALLGRHSEYFPVLYGTGKNGKSVLMMSLVKIYGDYASILPPETLTENVQKPHGGQAREDIVSMVGKRLVFVSEPEKTPKLNTSLIKRVTGGDRISARGNYGHQFEFTPKMSIFLATNHKPRVNEHNVAVGERVRMIPFEVNLIEELKKSGIPIRNQKDVVEEFVRTEGSGIFNWLITGLRAYQEAGDQIPFCTKVTTTTKNVLLESDKLGRCIEEIAEIDCSTRITRKDWLDAANSWCRDNDDEEFSPKGMAYLMREKEFKGDKVEGERYWIGLRLKTRCGNDATKPCETGEDDDTWFGV